MVTPNPLVMAYLKEYDFKDFGVKLTATSIIFEKNFRQFALPFFTITVDHVKDGGKIEIRQKDRWGSEMVFIHYMPSDLKGMFEFIANGYKVFEKFK